MADVSQSNSPASQPSEHEGLDEQHSGSNARRALDIAIVLLMSAILVTISLPVCMAMIERGSFP